MGPDLINEVPDLQGYTTITQTSPQTVSLLTELKTMFHWSEWKRRVFAGLRLQ